MIIKINLSVLLIMGIFITVVFIFIPNPNSFSFGFVIGTLATAGIYLLRKDVIYDTKKRKLKYKGS
jgi:hypothetical protein